MEPPEAIEADKRDATVRFVLEVESLAPVERRDDALHRCRAEGRVVSVERAPRASGPGAAPVPRTGEAFAVEVPCWPAARAGDDPPGPVRVHYGAEAAPLRLEVWGRIVDGAFVVSTFEERGPRR